MILRSLAWIGAVLALICFIRPATAQAPPPLTITTGGAAVEWRPLVRVHALLEDRALREALGSGLPLRFHFRVELWEDGFFDRLQEVQQIPLMMVQDPLDSSYTLATERNEQRYATLAEVESAIQGTAQFTLRPRGRGRFYYLATLEVETLSLSDLEELRRWLRGEAGPAVQGRRPVGRAVERGLRRTVVRLMGLPTRRYEARTATFAVR
ncbi:MAG TPA: hypothetical protein VGR27_07885 [Longimicrobiaceae bacterium]|nr:hypothetical protein [Longimicrobiaceae bacterium]